MSAPTLVSEAKEVSAPPGDKEPAPAKPTKKEDPLKVLNVVPPPIAIEQLRFVDMQSTKYVRDALHVEFGPWEVKK